MKMKNAIIVVASLAVGAAVGWFAGVLGNGERGMVGRVVPNAPMAAAWDEHPC